ncbi:hypothetical protein OPT61_g4934 [Boeremia exigua]|uniref:Uncharacterized protein n=1 Tax=Boeremia exigua TaxID=749465 RepID=A0ACC2IC53_9PLEO|nr:hypothetical protein OPT61_g4934 [Boeremia exigua]
MEQGVRSKTIPSTNTPNPGCSTAPAFTPPNPYARDPSRRAIACVTCAKAKTRCDKAVSCPALISSAHSLTSNSSHHAPAASPKASNAILAQRDAPQTTTTEPSPPKSPS